MHFRHILQVIGLKVDCVGTIMATPARDRFELSVSQCIYANIDCGVTVYKGTDRLFPSRPIAWKERICNQQICESLNRAYSLQSQISHKNISEVICFFHEEIARGQYRHVLITPLYVTDLNNEINRRSRKNTPWSDDEVMNILFSLVSCFAYCQKKSRSHRDIKPANIFQDKECCLKVGDFETARAIEGCSRQYTLAGTMPYLSPALRMGLAGGQMRPTHDPIKSDVYSLGVTVLEIALLKRPNLNTLYGLEERIARYIGQLTGPNILRSLLFRMLTVAEAARPDFVELLSLMSDQRLVSLSSKAVEQCVECPEAAISFCLCTFPVCALCANCVERHKLGALKHLTMGIAQKGDWVSERKVVSGREKAGIYGKIQNELRASLGNIEKMERKTRESYQKTIQILNNLQEKDLNFLMDYKAKITNLQTQYQLLLDSELKGEIDLQAALNAFPRPFFTSSLTFRPGPVPLSPVCISISEHLAGLSHIKDPESLPIPTLNNRLYLWLLQSREWLRSEIKSDVSLDEATIFTSLTPQELVGVGGIKRPKQAFVLDIFSGNSRELGEMRRERTISGGVLCVQGFVYVLGGEHEAASERLSVYTNDFASQEIAEMPEVVDNFNPAYWSEKIYIPGQSLWAYEISADRYVKIRTLRGMSQLISSAVVSDSLYIFTSDRTAVVDLRRNNVKYHDRFIVEYWSNPSPYCCGNSIYLICKADAAILQVDTSTMSSSTFNCPYPSAISR